VVEEAAAGDGDGLYCSMAAAYAFAKMGLVGSFLLALLSNRNPFFTSPRRKASSYTNAIKAK